MEGSGQTNFLEVISSENGMLAKKYNIIKKLGQGCFGYVYSVFNKENGVERALKIEANKTGRMADSLYNEFLILTKLKTTNCGIPSVYDYGEWEFGSYLEMEICGQDLFTIMRRRNKIQGEQLKQITVSMLRNLRWIHQFEIIHRDLKPQNIMKKPNNEYVLIDYGISYSVKNHQEKSLKPITGFVGTPRYASIAAHNNHHQGKKDDIEALLYVLAFLFYKKLPWFKLDCQDSQRIHEIKKRKIKKSQELFSHMGTGYMVAYQYVRDLSFEDQPNYEYLLSLFKRNNSLKLEKTPRMSTPQKKKISLPDLLKSNLLNIPIMKKDDEDHSKQTRTGGLTTFSQQVQIDLVGLVLSIKNNLEMSENIEQIESIEPERVDIKKYAMLTIKNPFKTLDNNV